MQTVSFKCRCGVSLSVPLAQAQQGRACPQCMNAMFRADAPQTSTPTISRGQRMLLLQAQWQQDNPSGGMAWLVMQLAFVPLSAFPAFIALFLSPKSHFIGTFFATWLVILFVVLKLRLAAWMFPVQWYSPTRWPMFRLAVLLSVTTIATLLGFLAPAPLPRKSQQPEIETVSPMEVAREMVEQERKERSNNPRREKRVAPKISHKPQSQTQQVVYELAQYYAKLKTFRCQLSSSQPAKPGESKDTTTYDVAIERPDKWRMVAIKKSIDLGGAQYSPPEFQRIKLLCDGTTLFVYSNIMKGYLPTDATATLDELGVPDTMLPQDLVAFLVLQMLVGKDPYAAFMLASSQQEYIGVEAVAETSCHKIRCVKNLGTMVADWQLWIEKGERPLLRKVAITFADAKQTEIMLDQWQTNPELPGELFTVSE